MVSALLKNNGMIAEVMDSYASNSASARQPSIVTENSKQRETHDMTAFAPRETSRARLLIGPYAPMVAEYMPYNPESTKVATWIIEYVENLHPSLKIEHIGSSSVPGCWGKGIIDLLVLYASGGLESVREVLDRLGFQHQRGPEPFPESRPMRVGSVEYFGRLYRIHAHVVESGSPEARDLIRFRDLLRSDNTLRQAYEREKRTILSRGVTKSTDYSKAKGVFILRVLSANK
jgi:GrpB-like predicted nucleotidyltransferase (UPF0157 family)